MSTTTPRATGLEISPPLRIASLLLSCLMLGAGCSASGSAFFDAAAVVDQGPPADARQLGDQRLPGDDGGAVADSGQDAAQPADSQPQPDAPWPTSWTGGKGGALGDSVQTLTHDGAKRYFAVHTPTGYSPAHGVALVLHFHGFRQLPAGIEDEVRYVWGKVADAKGFIAVAPEGLPCPWLQMGSTVACFEDQRDGAFVGALVQYLGNKYNIDKQRIYLSGHSGGAFFAQGHALSNANTFAAAVEFAGGCVNTPGYMNDCGKYAQSSKAATRKQPMFVVHNKLDQVVPYSESQTLLALLQGNGHPTQLIDTFNGGQTGHAINASLVPTVWSWMSKYQLP